jgi:hypothetical protein
MKKLLIELRWFFSLVYRPFDKVDGVILRISPSTAWKISKL